MSDCLTASSPTKYATKNILLWLPAMSPYPSSDLSLEDYGSVLSKLPSYTRCDWNSWTPRLSHLEVSCLCCSIGI